MNPKVFNILKCFGQGGVNYYIMKKIDTVVVRETLYITMWVIIFSAVMEAVFLALGRWDITVLLGNLLGGAAAVLNFFLMGLTVQNAVEKEEKDAKNLVRLSQTLRHFMLLGVAVIGFVVNCFNVVAMLVPLLFPSVAVKLRMLRYKDPDEGGEESK